MCTHLAVPFGRPQANQGTTQTGYLSPTATPGFDLPKRVTLVLLRRRRWEYKAPIDGRPVRLIQHILIDGKQLFAFASSHLASG